MLCRRCNLKEISDWKVVVDESLARRHRIVVCRMTQGKNMKKRKAEQRTKWWKLKKEECCVSFIQELRQALNGPEVLPDDWMTTANVIRQTGKRGLGVCHLVGKQTRRLGGGMRKWRSIHRERG